MISKESANRGLYNPHFFSVSIDGEFDADFEKMTDKDLGTFAHEYLHFLQNITTVFGLRHSILYYQYLQEVRQFILNSSSIRLPLKLNFLTSRINLGNQIFREMEGTKEPKNITYEHYELEISSKTVSNKVQKFVEIVFYTGNEKPERITFGSCCVKESMARIFQLEFDREATAFVVPYNTSDLIVKKLNQSLTNDKGKIFTYLILSLFHDNPGLAFYNLILNSEKESALNSLEIYRKHIYGYSVIGGDGIESSLQDYFKATLKDFKILLDSQTAGTINHFIKILENVELLYSSGNNPILQIFNDREIVGVEKLRILINQFGIPSLRTKSGFLSFPMDIKNQEPAIEFVDFMVQRTVIERLFESNEYPKICSLIQICNQDANLVDDCCYEHQWKRTTPCPFKVISDSWGLNEKIEND